MKSKLKSAVFFAAALILAAIVLPKPPLKEGLSWSKAVYDRNGRLLRLTLSADEKYRLWLPLSKISPLLIESTLLQEDRYFRWHLGVNPVSLARAANVTYLRKKRRVGGSTLTMQLARLRYGINSKSVGGKLHQIWKALQLELHYSKDEILEAYLNLVPYGGNVEGVGAASLVYFGKNADRLILSEALALTVIPQSPSRRSLNRQGPSAEAPLELTQARNRLFQDWVARYPLDEREEPRMALPIVMRRPSELPFLAPHFADAILKDRPDKESIHAALDLSLQKILERQVRGYVERKRGLGIRNAAAMLVDHRTMEVKAVLGSADFFSDEIGGQVNGTRARRSPASTLKPFIYALGIDQGLIHSLTMLKDTPTSFGGFNPENFDHEFVGPIKVRDALIHSRNIPAVQVASRLKSPNLYGLLTQAGITFPRDESYYGMAMVLGGAEITMEDLARLYAMLANGGLLRPLRFLPEDPESTGTRLLSEEASFMVMDILRQNPRPDQRFRKDWTTDTLPVHWKTGTSFAFCDAWSVGIFGPYVLAVWIGNFNAVGNPAFVGIEMAAPLFFQIVDAVKAHDRGLAPVDREFPKDLVRTEVCSVSGQVQGAICPQVNLTWFIAGKSPIETCQIHRKVAIDAATGLRACNENRPGVRSEVYEFWPSDMLKVFRAAGIPRRVPPADGPDCSSEMRLARGVPPQISSPRRGVVYNLRAGRLKDERVPLSAVTDADVREVFWFANKKFLGKSRTDSPFFWTPQPGKYIVRAVDDQGRSDALDLKVVVVE